MKGYILTPGNYPSGRSDKFDLDSLFFGGKPSGTDTTPIMKAGNSDGYEITQRDREIWAQSASLLIVGQFLIDTVQAQMLLRPEEELFFDGGSQSQTRGIEALIRNSKRSKESSVGESQTSPTQKPTVLFSKESDGLPIGVEGVPKPSNGIDEFSSSSAPLASGGLSPFDIRLNPIAFDAVDVVSQTVQVAERLGLVDLVGKTATEAAKEVATLLQTIYSNLDFLIGSRDSPFEPVFKPIFESPIGDVILKVLGTLKQYSGPETPDVFAANLIGLSGERNTMKIGSDETYILASLSERGDPRSSSPDTNDLAGQFELSVAGQLIGVNWQNGVYFGDYNPETSDTEGHHDFQTGNVDQSGAYFDGERLALVDFISLAPEAFQEQEPSPILGDFLPFSIPVEQLASALNRDSLTIAGEPGVEREFMTTSSEEVSAEDVDVAPDVQGDALLGLVEAPIEIVQGLLSPISGIAEAIPVVGAIVPELLAA